MTPELEDFEVTGTEETTADIDEGVYKATVNGLSTREVDIKGEDAPATYMDIQLDLDGEEEKISFGVPLRDNVHNGTMLGQLLSTVIGEPIKDGESYNIADVLAEARLKVTVYHDEDGFAQVMKQRDNDFAIKTVEE